jgi:hypothetical protein
LFRPEIVKGKRAAVPGTAALWGCSYFNPPAGQRALPEDQLFRGLSELPQGLYIHQWGFALVLFADTKLFALFDWFRGCFVHY